MARAPGTRQDDEVEGLDEEFLYHLSRGADLMGRGDAEAARLALTRARDLRPKDAKVLGLLGQSLYKLGRYDEAADVYGRLVDESPADAAARVNLGLANLKAKRHAAAVRQLEIALDLAPEHRKATGYLGLAWLEQGDFVRARELFARAGSEQMVARCDELLATAPPGAVVAATVEPQPGPEATPPVPAGPEDGPPAALVVPVEDAGEGAGEAGATFTITGERLTVRVRHDVLLRAEGLLATRGPVRLLAQMKHYRGSATEKPFGQGVRRVFRASGDGEILYRLPGLRLAAVALGREPTYLVEAAVFAFEDALSFENGRVASRIGADLDLVHLKGEGTMLLATRGEVVSLEVTLQRPARVPVCALVGWSGALTPRIELLAEDGGGGGDPAAGELRAVELSGSGRVLVDDGAALGA